MLYVGVERHAGRIIYLEYDGSDVKNTYMFVGKVYLKLVCWNF